MFAFVFYLGRGVLGHDENSSFFTAAPGLVTPEAFAYAWLLPGILQLVDGTDEPVPRVDDTSLASYSLARAATGKASAWGLFVMSHAKL